MKPWFESIERELLRSLVATIMLEILPCRYVAPAGDNTGISIRYTAF